MKIQRNNLLYYDQWAAQWWQKDATVAPLSRLNPLRFHFFDRYISDWQGLKVLDVGCGGGFTCEFLAQRGAQVVGVDQSAACVEAASRHAGEVGLSIDYRCAVGEKLPFAAATFDVVTCVDVLEHVADPAQTIAEISRVLKPGGQFCFDTINRTWQSRLVMIWLLENALRQIPIGVHDWDKFITPAELSKLLEQQKILPVAMTGFDLFGKGVAGKWRSLQRYWQNGEFEASFEADADRVMYIGVATKSEQRLARSSRE